MFPDLLRDHQRTTRGMCCTQLPARAEVLQNLPVSLAGENALAVGEGFIARSVLFPMAPPLLSALCARPNSRCSMLADEFEGFDVSFAK
jgi:hypothetical protein